MAWSPFQRANAGIIWVEQPGDYANPIPTTPATGPEAELKQLNGAAFDKAYADNEVAYHKTVNNALETVLIPDANNPELKDLLTTGLKIFQGHEQHAEHVAQSLK